jgi:ankyrin repeat protein
MSDFIAAAAEGEYTVVDEALLAGERPDSRDDCGRTALHWAAQEGHIEIVRRLIAARAGVNERDDVGFTVLDLAVGEDHEDVVRELLMAGASPNLRNELSSNFTALHVASSWNRLGVAKLLVELGNADVNAVDDEGNTPLRYARDGGFESLAQYLIRHGADA